MNMRMAVAIAAIAAVVAIVYVFSIVPYIVTTQEGRMSGQISPGLEIILPATAIPLILILVFLVPPSR